MSRRLDDSPKPVDPDPDAIGPDGRVQLRCYLPLADTPWFSAGCSGWDSCGHLAQISVPEAVRLMGSGEATVGQLKQRLRCSRCGSRRVGVDATRRSSLAAATVTVASLKDGRSPAQAIRTG